MLSEKSKPWLHVMKLRAMIPLIWSVWKRQIYRQKAEQWFPKALSKTKSNKMEVAKMF